MERCSVCGDWVETDGEHADLVYCSSYCRSYERNDGWPENTVPKTDDPVYFNTMTNSDRRPYIHRASDN